MHTQGHNDIGALTRELAESLRGYANEARAEQGYLKLKFNEIPERLSSLVDKGSNLAAQQKILNSLHFRDMNSRYTSIRDHVSVHLTGYSNLSATWEPGPVLGISRTGWNVVMGCIG